MRDPRRLWTGQQRYSPLRRTKPCLSFVSDLPSLRARDDRSKVAIIGQDRVPAERTVPVVNDAARTHRTVRKDGRTRQAVGHPIQLSCQAAKLLIVLGIDGEKLAARATRALIRQK